MMMMSMVLAVPAAVDRRRIEPLGIHRHRVHRELRIDGPKAAVAIRRAVATVCLASYRAASERPAESIATTSEAEGQCHVGTSATTVVVIGL